jgi:hypothetical protein
MFFILYLKLDCELFLEFSGGVKNRSPVTVYHYKTLKRIPSSTKRKTLQLI